MRKLLVLGLILFVFNLNAMKKREGSEPGKPQPTKKAAISSLEWQHQLANFDRLPTDLKKLILEKIIISSKTLDEAIKEIKKIRLISKASNAFISNLATLQWIISKLAHDFSNQRVDKFYGRSFSDYSLPYISEETVFNKLHPLTNTDEMKAWLEKQQPFITWKKQFQDALESRNEEKLKQLLEENKVTFQRNINEIAIGGELPLYFASSLKWPEGIKLLLHYGADSNLKNPNRYSFTGSLPFQAPYSSDAFDSTSYIEETKNTVQALLEGGADINKQDNYGNTLLKDIIYDLLLHKNYDENGRAEDSQKYYDFIKYLLESGANPNISDNDGYTPLLMVLLRSFRDPNLGIANLVKLLMQFGADPNLRLSISAKEIYEYELDEHFEEILEDVLTDEQMKQYFNIRKILDKEADVEKIKPVIQDVLKLAQINNQDVHGNTALKNFIHNIVFNKFSYDENKNTAVSAKLYNFIKRVLESGANPNISDNDGFTPLLIVLLRNFRNPNLGVAELVKLLIQFGADPNLRLSISAKKLYEYENENREQLRKYLTDEQIERYLNLNIRKILNKESGT